MPKSLLLLTVGLSLISYAHADLVAHYSLDETDAGNNNVTDSFGLNDGTLISPANVAKGVAAPHGTGYDFALRGGANLGTGNQVRPDDQFTISWWFRPTTLNSYDRLYESLSGTNASGQGIRIDLGGSGTQLRCLLRDGNGTTSTAVVGPGTLLLNTWYFFALRYDSLGGNAKVTLLADTGGDITNAVISSNTTTLTSLGTNNITHANGVFIAADDAAASNPNDFGGAMDDIAFFQTGNKFGVLSDTDLAEVYNNGALAFDPPTPEPTFNAFAADDETVSSGATVNLSWDVSNADTLSIAPDIGSVANPSGSIPVTATETTIYTLSATNAQGSFTQSIQITVDGQYFPLEISEFVASNSSFDDGDGNSSDWIEIHNPNLVSFDLGGYYLTDDPNNLQEWPFPAGTTLVTDEYKVVFASGQATANYVDAGGNLHTNFSLSSNGEYLALVAPDGSTILQEFAPGYPNQKNDTSYSTDGFRLLPTPGEPNIGTPQLGFVADTTFSVDRGFYAAPFDVAIVTSTPGAEIYYTTDGSPPSSTDGTLYTAPINISTTTVLRAAGFKDLFIPTNTDTQSYLFLADILTQPNNPPNTTTSWAGHPADYEMDPDIVNHPNYTDELIPALEKFPSLSLAIEPDDFYGTFGLYQNPQSQGSNWERPVSAELMFPDGSEPGFRIGAGLRIQGGSSRNADTPKHSLSLRFRTEYGAGKLKYPLFKDAPSAGTAVEKFDTLQLRSGYNFGWTHRHYYQCDAAQYNRDQWANDLMLALGSEGSHGRWVHLYINGLYWGIYHLHERPDNNYMAEYFGGDGDDYDAINSDKVTSGTITAYNALKAHAAAGLSDPADYETMKQHLDIDSFADYMLVNFYTGNRDWDGHNWRAAGQGPGGEPFRYFTWDTEFAISPWAGGVFQNPASVTSATTLNTNRTGVNNARGPTAVHQDLTANAEYRLLFGDKAHAAMFNGGPMTPEGATAIWRTRSDDMDLAIVAESARWGDFRRDVEAGSVWNSNQYDLYTRDDHYLPIQGWIIDTYMQQRPAIVLDQLRARGLYPQIDAPTYSQDASALTIANPNASGEIIYTLDGTDPRDPSATVYSDPFNLANSTRVNSRVRALDGATVIWSALQSVEVFVGTPADASNLTISELHYNPPGSEESGEFIEFTNLSSDEIDLSGVTFAAGLTYTFPVGTTLATGARLVIGATDYDGNLDNAGETITLHDADGVVIESFTYNDKAPWPEAADGDGFSLVRISPPSQLDPDQPTSWRASTALGGNPGSSDATTFPGGDEDALLAYAFGENELQAQAGGGFLTFSQNVAADDLIYTVEHSYDLASWSTTGALLGATAPIGGFSTNTFALIPLDPPRTRHFFRVRVDLRLE
ncbi:MAG: hypothetical protein ACI9UA_003482 [Pseudoalteromonas tetraodonis]|jgi:hypothetical protein